MARLSRSQPRTTSTGSDNSGGEHSANEAETDVVVDGSNEAETDAPEPKEYLFSDVVKAINEIELDANGLAVPTLVTTTAPAIPTHYKTTRFGVALRAGEINEVTFSNGSKQPLFTDL